MQAQRSFLFLQGNASRFFAELGVALDRKGYTVRRINFHGGDRLFWSLPKSVDYRRDLKHWPAFLARHLDDWAVTDILLFGDCRPLHRVAVRMAKERGIRVYVFEEGYLRPHWITMDLGGTNGFSSLPRDPAWYRAAASRLPPWTMPEPVVSTFARRSWDDVLYNTGLMSTMALYPGYRTHRPWHPIVEYGGWLYRFARAPAEKRRIAAGLARIGQGGRPFYFYPLQLDCDTQIRQHSPFGRIAPSLHAIIDSFARYAPPESQLVIKEHPLDNCLTNWRRMTARIVREAGVADRVIYLENGPLDRLLADARAVVTVNSTVGFQALAVGKPVIALGSAIYAMPSLTYQGELDRFWTDPVPPDAATFDAFRRVVADRALVVGSFFSTEGVVRAVAGTIERLERTAKEAGSADIAYLPTTDPDGLSAPQKSRTSTR